MRVSRDDIEMGKTVWKNAEEAVETITEVLKTQSPQECFAQVERALEYFPNTAELHSIAGVCFLLQHNDQKALEYFNQAVSLSPQDLRYQVNKAELLTRLGFENQAFEVFQSVLNIDPRHESAYVGMGNIYQERGVLDLAVAQFARAVRFNPQSVTARNNYASALLKLGDVEASLTESKKVLELQPEHNTALRRVAKLLAMQNGFKEVVTWLVPALEYHPNDSFLQHELGKAYDHCSSPELAAAHLLHAHSLDPENTKVILNLGKSLHDSGRIESAIEKLTPAAKANLSETQLWSNLLMLHHYVSVTTRAERFSLHTLWGKHMEQTTQVLSPRDLTQEDPQRSLKIGFLSPDLRSHPVGYFLLPLFENTPEGLTFHAFQNSTTNDEVTERLKVHCATWHNLRGMDHDEVAALIRDEQIDILFDLAGHTSDHRLQVFACKPAPVQVTGLGYVDTTGLRRMDYLLGDKHQTPAHEDHFYTEKVWRMPDDYIVYSPPKGGPNLASLPALKNGFITFGSCNKPAKMSREVIALWCRILVAVPQSKLILRNMGLDKPSIQAQFTAKFSACGVGPERIIFRGGASHFDLLSTYNDIDIALDTTPYSGGLTTLEALWMGVPVLTHGGNCFASRHSATHLCNAGLEDWVAQNEDHMVALAQSWANNLKELSRVRDGLRAQLTASPVCDGPRYAENFRVFMRTIWCQALAEQTP